MGPFNWVVDKTLPVMDIVTPRNVCMCGVFGSVLLSQLVTLLDTMMRKLSVESPLVDTVTPYNVQLCGFYKRSFAYFTIKERLPIIITKIVDHLSKDRDSIASEYGELALEEVKQVIGYLSKLKNEIQTNKKFITFQIEGTDSKKWNYLIMNQPDPYYFTAIWLFTECYVYRRIREAFELTNSLNQFDPFRAQKDSTFGQSLEAMCLVANHLIKKLEETDKVKENFLMLLKMTLWGNKCDLSSSAGEDVSQATNPMAMVDLWHDNLIADDSNIIYDAILNLTKTNEGEGALVDIVCDNAGYELFVDLCFADFLVTNKIAKKVRFRVKAIPWFVSDVLVRDFFWTINKTCDASFTKEISSSFTLDSSNLNIVGKRWKQYVDQGVWTCQSDEFWTLPHEFYKMKTEDNELYKSLGEASIVFFKGDLNYRKLMGEMNWPPTTSFEDALRGFFPSPLVAVRTVKADLISGLPAGKMEELNKKDNQWMEKGDYGVIQFCDKKVS